MRIVEIHITGVIPDHSDVGHEVVFLTREPVAQLVALFQERGLTNCTESRRIVSTKQTATKRQPPVVSQDAHSHVINGAHVIPAAVA